MIAKDKRKSQEEKAWKESQAEEEGARKWCAAYKDAARGNAEIPGGQDVKVERTVGNAGRSRYFYHADCQTSKT